MTEITRKWLEEQVSLTWTDDISEWYRNSSELITNILNNLEPSPKFEVGDVVDWVNSAFPEEFGRATIKDIESLPTYYLRDDEGREWINVKQDNMVKVKDKELVPHAHTFDCKDWKTCDCPIISPFKVGNKVTCSDHDQRLWRIQVIKDDGLVLVEVNPERPGNPQWRYRVKPESCSLVNDFSDWPNNDRDK